MRFIVAKRSAKTSKIVAEICLYGNHETGAGYLATIEGQKGLLGTGEPVKGRSMTEAVWLAVREIMAEAEAMILTPGPLFLDANGRPAHEGPGPAFRSFTKGTVRIFASGDQMFADAPLTHVPAVGDLEWVRCGVKEGAWAL
jgi:hypothetical protein